MTTVRHIPHGDDGRDAVFVTTPGGMLDEMADTLERHLVQVARKDALRAKVVAADDTSTMEELRCALGFAASTIKSLCELLDERLGAQDD